MESAKPKSRRWRPRYSLRSLMLLTVFCGTVMLVWRNWEPWALTRLKHDRTVYHSNFSPNGKWLAAQTLADCSVWSIPSGTLICQFPALDWNGARWSPDSKLLMLDGEASVELVSTENWSRLGALPGAHAVTQFSPDSKRALSSKDGFITIWDVPNTKRLATLDHDKRICGFSDNSLYLLLQTRHGIEVIQASTGNSLWKADPTDMHETLIGVTFSKDQSRVLTKWKTVEWQQEAFRLRNFEFCREYEMSTGHIVANSGEEPVINNQKGDFLHWAFTPSVSVDGRKLETGINNVLQVTDPLGENPSQLAGFQLYTITGNAVFSPDGRSIAAANYNNDKDVCLWSLRRNETKWGVVSLPEFWLAVFTLLALLTSAVIDQLNQTGVKTQAQSPFA